MQFDNQRETQSQKLSTRCDRFSRDQAAYGKIQAQNLDANSGHRTDKK